MDRSGVIGLRMKSLITIFLLLSSTSSFITAKGGECYPGFHRYGRSCYWFSTITGIFGVARTICEHMGSHLAVITSKSEDTFLRSYALQRGKASVYYLGGSDLGLEGWWRWEGEKHMVYTNWQNSNPDNYKGKEHCLTLWSEYGYKWNDLSCDANVNFICEQDLQ